jgi:REP element-mobilizing transposase RayT
MQNSPKGWHSRGYLPHFDGEDTVQFVTVRLSDSLPKNLLDKWRRELENEQIDDPELRKRIEHYLDQGHGEAFLRRPDIADIIQNSILHLDGKSCYLISWVVMPNHVHLLIKLLQGKYLRDFIKMLKGFTAREANKILDRKGKFWQEDYFDRYIRDEKHYFSTINYIENNPVKAGLCKRSEEWRHSSAFYRK